MAVGKNLALKNKWNIRFSFGFRRFLLGGLFFFALTLLLFVSALPKKYDIKVGDILQESIVAEKEAVDLVATRKLQRDASDNVPKKYLLDHNTTNMVSAETQRLFEAIRDVRLKEETEEEDKAQTLKKKLPEILLEENYLLAVKIDDAAFRELEVVTKAILEKIMEGGVKEDSLDWAKIYMIEEFRSLKISQELKNLGEDIAFSMLRPNMVYDSEATELLRQEAVRSVSPVKIARNEIIIEKGTSINSEHRELLKDLGLLVKDTGVDLRILGSSAVFAAIFTGILFFGILLFRKELLVKDAHLLLMVLVIIFTLGISLSISSFSKYLIPLATGSMLISILIDPIVGILSGFVMASSVGIMLINDFTFFFLSLINALVGVYSAAKVSQRSDLTKAGGIIGVMGMLSIMAMEISGNSSLWTVVSKGSWGMINGVLSAVLAIGTLPFLENAFRITSSIKLLELSNPNQPLLRRLMVDAPGTYHHSIIVGNLAEAAAGAVGADPLLARVGANYHDIGKLKRPYFFIENQLTPENPHDKLNPSLSALIILSHVKDGLEIAKEYTLPKLITDFIAQHHGNSLLAFFYHKAVEADPNKEFEEAGFRYEGPRPQSREIAIVMLADCVEAAVRSMSKPTPGKIEGFIRQLIKDKLSDGQLDESDLTLRDLENIANAFSRVLTGIFHSRIEYPDKLKELQGKVVGDA